VVLPQIIIEGEEEENTKTLALTPRISAEFKGRLKVRGLKR
tara:strand:- start:163 stop:285 length:123 start_codon:yes stop_codon:yes gene_type:complete